MAKIVTYTVDWCPYCKKAKKILTEKGIDFEDNDITVNEAEMRKKLGEMTAGKTSVPQIFINDKHIGGYTDLKELNESGNLDELLKE